MDQSKKKGERPSGLSHCRPAIFPASTKGLHPEYLLTMVKYRIIRTSPQLTINDNRQKKQNGYSVVDHTRNRSFTG
jgi:hypothetical protein